MGKEKKIKKGGKEKDGDSEVEIETPTTNKELSVKNDKQKMKSKTEENVSDEEDVKVNKKKGNKGADTKKVDVVTKGMKKLNVGSNKSTKKKNVESDDDDSETESDSDDSAPKSKTKNPQQKPGFSLLLMGDSSEESQESEEEQSESEEEEEKPKVVQKKVQPKEAPKEQAGKKGKKAKRKKDESDDDIDKVLAELEFEYSGKKPQPQTEAEETSKPVEKEKTKKGKSDAETKAEDQQGEDEEVSTVKSAAQKKKEKKEREKLKKQMAKKQEATAKKGEAPKESTPEPTPEVETKKSDDAAKPEGEGEAEDVGDKKKKKKKGEKEKAEEKSKKPDKKVIAAMQEALRKIKEDEEKAKREEEERIRQEEEKERQRLEQLRIEKEKKDKKKKKEKERKEKLKAEGKFLTPKQKADKARALAMIESLKNQGGGIEVEKKAPRLGTRIKPNKSKKDSAEQQSEEHCDKVDVEIVDGKDGSKKDDLNKEAFIKDSWDAESMSSENEEDEDSKTMSAPPVQEKPVQVKPVQVKSVPSEQKGKKQESSSEESDSDDCSDSDDEDDAIMKAQEREKTLMRMKKRQEENEAKKSESIMRAAIVCVLGHVDTGKTKILDKLRRTNVQDGEAGGITQQIGATNVPIDNIKEQTKHVKGVNTIAFKIPGLLIIDTPGHESFSNLRSRGSSLCDIAILVVDIMHGLEPQTKESINLLKARKTPFVVALNKIDRLYDWQSMQRKDIKDIIKAQHIHTQNEFDTRTKEVILQFANEGLNAALYYENPDVRTYVSLVPTSAITGEGMGNLLALIVQLCENMLHKRLLYSETLQATVLEVKAIPGLGTTIDAILINGKLRETDTIVLAGTDGPIVTQIRSLLMPQPMKELRVKNAYIEYKEIVAAQGVKIAAKDLEKAVAGLNLQVAHKTDEIDILKEEVSRDFKSALSSIRLSERGVYVQASTLGSLEALLEFLKSSSIPYSAIKIGPVVKRDVMKASAMLEHESQYAVILAFDVKIERDAQELADSLGVTIFQADIIYHLFDKFMAHRDALKARKREEFKHIAVFPCKLRVLPQFVFNSRDPIVMGVIVEAGIVKEGTPICVPSKEFVDIGIVSSIESNHKQVESARKGMEVCIKIDPIPGESPKMFGRHFDETDFLVSKISRASIDACKDYFRDDLMKTDWQLMVELKNLFQIM